MEIADFVARAEGAEKKLAALASRCQELEAAVATLDATKGGAASASSGSSNIAVSSSSKASLLASLQSVRDAVVADAAEREQLRKENEQLKVQLGKAQYRANHLVKMLEEEEKKVAALKK